VSLLREDLACFIINYACCLGASYADVRIESYYNEHISIVNGEVVSALMLNKHGFSVRVIVNGAWGFQASPRTSIEDAKRAVELAIKSAKASSLSAKEPVKLAPVKVCRDNVVAKVKVDVESVPTEDKVDELLEADRRISSYKEITSRSFSYTSIKMDKFFASSEGARISFKNTVSWIWISATAKRGDSRSRYRWVEGGSGGYELVSGDVLYNSADKVARKAIELLDAEPAKSMRNVSVVMDPDFVSLLVHEIIGHPSEADRVLGREAAWAGTTWWAGMLGQKIGSDYLNAADDPTVEGTLGYYLYDDEGVPARKKVLIERGVLREHMHSRETAAIFNAEANAGMRAITYEYFPLIRMSNTFIEPGDWKPEEIIEETKFGVYVCGRNTPSIDDKRYNWTISAKEGWLIENGELTKHLKNVWVMSTAPSFFKSIDAVANDLTIRPIPGCGKGEPYQLLYVGNGGPHIRGVASIVGR